MPNNDFNIARRRLLAGTAASLAGGLMAIPSRAAAPAWPSKPIRLLVPFPTGTPPDISSRLVAGHLSPKLGQPVYVENKPGAIGLVSLGELLRQPADGHTLYCMLTPVTTAGTLLPAQRVDLQRELQPVSQVDWVYSVLVVNNDVKASNVKDFCALLREHPQDYSFGSGGNGTPAHLAGELFKQQQKVEATHVPYAQFSQAVPDLISGRIQFMFLTSNVALPLVQSKKIRALGVVGKERIAGLPDVPTLAEQGMGDFDTRSWDGIVVKAGTPPAIVQRLNEEIREVLSRPDVAARFTEMGMVPQASSPQQLGELIQSESTRWAAVIKAANISVQ